jgi:hypothetical protein
MTIREEKLGGVLIDQSIDVLWIGTRAIFLGSSAICPTLLSQRERLPRTACKERVCIICIRFLLQDVH